MRAFSQANGASLVHLHNVSGGILSGDDLSLEIDVGPGAAAQITTTGATRLYRHRQGLADSRQRVEIHVGKGALLEYLPDAIIPFAGSRHAQRTSISLADGAILMWWEVLAPGRQAMGEKFAFDSLQLRTEVRSSKRPLLIESSDMRPAIRPLTSLARLGPYTHAANFYAFSVGAPATTWRELELKMNAVCSARSTPGVTIWGSSALAADGLAVRGLSASALELPATLAHVRQTAKRALTGEDAIPPRKVY